MDSPRGRVARSVLWALLALVILGVGVVSALQVRGALDREREYRAARACAATPVRASGCVWEQSFTVRETDLHRGERAASPEARLVLPSGKVWRVTFPRAEPVLSGLEPGDRVTGVVWHGRVVEVREPGGARQQTSDGPVGWPADRLGGALACVSFGLAGLVGGLWSLVARGERHAKAGRVVRWHGVGLGAAAVLSLWAQTANDWPIWAILAIWGPLALLVLASMTAFTIAALRGELGDEAPVAA
ncbi:hypothetical protein ACH4C6_07865 [Streptomyces sp. NPDC017943]|uniref:hypothetical protein n=1 Tax=Streptomyces sp. NPDC017943 TaxID=3365019 RepID=UPI0037B5990D